MYIYMQAGSCCSLVSVDVVLCPILNEKCTKTRNKNVLKYTKTLKQINPGHWLMLTDLTSRNTTTSSRIETFIAHCGPPPSTPVLSLCQCCVLPQLCQLP